MFDIVFLGTSASAPSIHRGLSSAAVLAGEERFLIDCGEGTQRQILRSGIGFKRLNRILLTHPHLDHILGLGGLVSTFTRWESMDELHIWGGNATLERVHSLLFDVVLRNQRPPIPIHLNPVAPGVLVRQKKYTVSAFPVVHRGPGCFGYIFQEDTHRPFLAEKANALDVPFGPERSQLVRGEAVTLADGRIITPEMVLDEAIPGVKIVFTGDVGRIETVREAAQDADALVIEGTFLHAERDMARQFGHITIRQAAELAAETNCRYLLITHVSRRYREQDMIAEAKAIFPNAFVVRDFDQFTLRRGKPIIKQHASYRNNPDAKPEIIDQVPEYDDDTA